MGWIGVELRGNITPRESEQTSIGSFFTRKLDQPTKETKQMTAEYNAGAVSHTTNVRRLASAYRKGDTGGQMGQGESPATIAHPLFQWQSLCRETSDRNCCETAFREVRLKGLSGINGNISVPFLGGLGAAMPPGYPAGVLK